MLFCTFLSAVFPAAPIPYDVEVEELLSKLRIMYASPETARLEVAVRQVAEGGFTEFTVRFEYAKPNKLRVEVTQDDKKQLDLVSDGKKVAIFEAGGRLKETKDFDVKSLEKIVPANLETISFYDWQRQLSTAECGNMHNSVLKITKDELWNGKTWTILEETTPEAGVIVKYFIDKDTNLIWRTLVRTIEGNRLLQDCQVLKMERGIAIDPARFVIPGL